MSPAQFAWRGTWDPATPSSRCSAITARAIKAGCSTRNSCAKRGCPCRDGSTTPRPRRPACSSSYRIGEETLSTPKTWLIETDELERELDAPDFVIIDATWYMPNQGKDAKAVYQSEHIPGCLLVDIDEIADTNSTLPHMLPATDKIYS